MRSLRLITSTLLGAVLLLGLGGGAVFAGQGHVVETYDLDDAWCFDDVVQQYCFVQEGTFTIVTKHDGGTVGKVDMTLTVEVTADGAFVASYTTETKQDSRTNVDGTYSFTWRERTRWSDGEQTCDTATRLKIVDFEVIVDSIDTNCH